MLLLLSVGAAARERPLLDRVLEVDARILGGPADAARSSADAIAAQARACVESDGSGENCLVRATLGDGGIAGLQPAPAAAANTVTHALAERRGSCAAIVAVLLALGEKLQVPFTVIVLRDHVLLGSAADPDVAYEALDHGRIVRLSELHRYGPMPPGGTAHVTGADFLPYDLDNLAARLAEVGDVAVAERTFREAVSIAPRVARVRYNLGTFLVQQERYREGERELTRAIDRGWEDADAYVNRGVARWTRGRIGPARRDFEQALALDPGNRDAATNLRQLGTR